MSTRSYRGGAVTDARSTFDQLLEAFSYLLALFFEGDPPSSQRPPPDLTPARPEPLDQLSFALPFPPPEEPPEFSAQIPPPLPTLALVPEFAATHESFARPRPLLVPLFELPSQSL